MIEGIEPLYQRIAASIVEAIPQPWSSAQVNAIFYSDSIDFEAEYTAADGGIGTFATTLDGDRAFRELRRKFKEAGKPLWGQALFVLQADGKFKMTFGYENCDEQGNTIFDADEWRRRFKERHKRL